MYIYGFWGVLGIKRSESHWASTLPLSNALGPSFYWWTYLFSDCFGIMNRTTVDTCEHVLMWMKAFNSPWRVSENRGAGLQGNPAHQLRNGQTVSHSFVWRFQSLHFLIGVLSFTGLIPAGTVCRWLVICILGARRPLHLFETYSCI